MRIIAGKYKNRIIPFSKGYSYRPSTTKFREALFSIMSSGEFICNPLFKNADILDLFAGTGSLSFEALSRGAKTITLLDNKRIYLKIAQDFAIQIGETKNVHYILASAINLPLAYRKYSLIFMDPPYYNQLVKKSLLSLIQNQWLKPNSTIIVEMEKYEELPMLQNVSLIKQKIYGNSQLLILRYDM